ncbi:hypothetical protein CPB84DRAFT_1755241 [Gymnopilus junonius]|uniref:Uncharacterized protein n=1 Tax=Gymnopilus junonius TaxID=109634 RepID=A0A9P5N7B6_GYMJU|nr:hypothetical protein CPB84DRAFT_1755241 [Gymnopilus junonius]
MPYEPNLEYWTPHVKPDGSTVFTCKPCADHRERLSYNCKGHEETDTHNAALMKFMLAEAAKRHSQAVNSLPNSMVIEDGFRTLLLAATGNVSLPLYPPSHPALPPGADITQNSPSPITGIDWNLLEARRFSYENKDLLVAEEPEDDVSLPEVGVSPSDDSDVHESQQARTQAGSKHGRGQPGKLKTKKAKTTKTTKAGRVPDGEDFWSRVDKWFEEEIEKRGKSTNFAGPAWKGYVDETIHQDNEHFNCPASARQGGLATSLSHQSTESMLSISQLNTPAVPHSAPMFSSQPSTSNPGISFAASPQQQFSFMQTGMPSLLMAAHGQ